MNLQHIWLSIFSFFLFSFFFVARRLDVSIRHVQCNAYSTVFFCSLFCSLTGDRVVALQCCTSTHGKRVDFQSNYGDWSEKKNQEKREKEKETNRDSKPGFHRLA